MWLLERMLQACLWSSGTTWAFKRPWCCFCCFVFYSNGCKNINPENQLHKFHKEARGMRG